MRVFFDFSDGNHVSSDDEGHECEGMDEARTIALKFLPEVLLTNVRDVHEREVTCDIRGECGTVLYRASVILKGQTIIRL